MEERNEFKDILTAMKNKDKALEISIRFMRDLSKLDIINFKTVISTAIMAYSQDKEICATKLAREILSGVQCLDEVLKEIEDETEN